MGKTFYNALLILAALAGTVITSYRLTFRARDFDALYWLITAVYLLDIACSFNQAVKKGLVVLADRKSIARHYLRGWFTVDLVAALPFGWFFAQLFPQAAAGGVGALLDLLMIGKALKMAKIGKVSAIFRDIREGLSVNPALMRLVTFGFWFVTALHLMACGWVLIGAGEQGRPAADQYLRALYWCLTTIATIGYGDYTPDKNSNLQIAYTLGVMVFGVGMYGYIIGNVATLIANLDVARAVYRTKMEEINDFLRRQRVPAGLQKRVGLLRLPLGNAAQRLRGAHRRGAAPLPVPGNPAVHQPRADPEGGPVPQRRRDLHPGDRAAPDTPVLPA
jgi:voltage-gated potassium channel